MYSKRIKIPAKAMLFGEYGVLYGASAVALTFFDHYFEILFNISFTQNLASANVHIISDYFSTKQSNFLVSEIENDENDFFKSLLFPWRDVLSSYCLTIDIQHSFSKNLGFGSSSALIASVSYFLWSFFYPKEYFLESSVFWSKIYESIYKIQTKGSGYDVAVQLLAQEFINHPDQNKTQNERKLLFWQFLKEKDNFVPKLNQIYLDANEIKNYGCFIKTSQYSNTKQSLSFFSSQAEKEIFAKLQADLAQEFLKDTRPEHLIKLFARSRSLCVQQGILDEINSSYAPLIQRLNQANIPYKSMGAGFGDCLWVLAKHEQLIYKIGVSCDDIVFKF